MTFLSSFPAEQTATLCAMIAGSLAIGVWVVVDGIRISRLVRAGGVR